MSKFIVILLLNLLMSLSVFPETIVLESGEIIEGRIIERADNYVTVDFYGISLRYYLDDIKNIYENEKPENYKARDKTAKNITIGRNNSAVRVDNKCFLWKVKSRGSVVYLFGSIHVGTKAMYPLDKRIENAFRESDVLVVEANINNNQALGGLASYLDYALYKEGKNLKNSLRRRTYDLMKNKLKGMGLSVELLNMYRPWYVAILLDSLQFLKLGYDPEYGIDSYFLNKAEGKKEILEFESVEYQIKLLSSFSDKEQDLFLYYTLLYLDTMGKSMKEIISAWKNGNSKAMDSILIGEILSADPGMAVIFDRLMYKRNKLMAERIERFLVTGGDYFVVVGAGHLVGEKGIVALLEDRGYSLIQL